ELTKHLSETEMWNGFANRFLWLLVRRSKLLPDGGAELDLTNIQAKLGEAVEQAKQTDVLKRGPAAAELWHTIYPELTHGRPGLYGAATARAEAMVLRLSMLYALLDKSNAIDVPHLKAALAMWTYSDASAQLIFGSGDAETDDPLAARLLLAIRQ